MAGLGSGVTEAIIVNPFEVVKVKMQSNRSHQSQSPSTWSVTFPIVNVESSCNICRSVAREIIKEDGLGKNGLLGKGITATMGRNGFFNMIYFGFYHTMKGWLPSASDPSLEFCRKVCLGLTAGTLGCCVNIPFDVAKSRIQGPQAGTVKYRGTLAAIGLVYREEG